MNNFIKQHTGICLKVEIFDRFNVYWYLCMFIKVEGYIGMFTSTMYLSLFLEPCRSCWYDSVPSPQLPPRPPHQWAPSHTMTQVRQVFTVWPLSTPFRYKILLSFHCHLCSHFILVNLRYMIYFIMNNFRKVFILFILFFVYINFSLPLWISNVFQTILAFHFL